MQGLGGDDTITFTGDAYFGYTYPGSYWHYSRDHTIYALGGDGNDIIKVAEVDKALISGGAGDDTITVSAASKSQIVELGTGTDSLHFQGVPLSFLYYGSVYTTQTDVNTVVTNFTPGVDKFDTASLVQQMASSDTAGDPFVTGQLQLVQFGANTLLQGHIGYGTPAQTDWVTLVTFDHLMASQLGYADLGYNPVVATSHDLM